MEMTKINNMEVAIEGNRMIGRCKGPIKAIQSLLENTVEVVEETTVVDLHEDIDMDDYKLFCDWMIANGGTPSIEEYRQAIAYYSNASAI